MVNAYKPRGENPTRPPGDLHCWVMASPLREIGLQSGGRATDPLLGASRANVFEDVSRPQGIGVFERSLSFSGQIMFSPHLVA